ncbi:MAG: flagella basal body P-ring formation protein FlgA [Candidatus Korobacteraceae bacterium]
MRHTEYPACRLAQSLLVLVALAAMAQMVWALPKPSPLQQQAAEAVVRDMKLESESTLVEQNLEVLAPFTSLPAGSALHVISARAGFTPGTWILRLDCALRRDCLPFHAVLRLPEGERLLSPDGGSLTAKLPTIPAGRVSGPGALVRRGAQMELVEELPGVRLRATVVCLESGGLGDRIRVENRDTHRVVLATVAGPELVLVKVAP